MTNPKHRICEYEPCGSVFAPGGNTRQRFCSRQCRIDAYSARHFKPQRLGLPSATVGAVGEMVAAVDLMKRGYEVFRALSAACSSDLIALRDGVPLRIEVRTGQRSLLTGKLTWARNGGKQGRSEDDLDHYAVVVAGELILYDPPLPEPETGFCERVV